MKTIDEKKKFYDTCAEILCVPHEFSEPVRRRTRWNTRKLGNGRYPGFGLVQCFGSHIRVISKHGTRMFNDYDQVYEYLEKMSKE